MLRAWRAWLAVNVDSSLPPVRRFIGMLEMPGSESRALPSRRRTPSKRSAQWKPAGVAGVLGSAHVAKSNPDGYTLLLGTAAGISAAPRNTDHRKQ